MIDLDVTDGLAMITLQRPDKANALTGEMLASLVSAVDQAQGCAALVLTGGGKVFSAGADLEAARAGLAVSPLWEQLSGAISDFPGLTIAALNGTCAGGAMGMILACDLRIAVPGTSVFYPVMKLGFLPQPSDPARLAGLVGPSRARMILMAGQKIATDEALAWGLFDRVVPREDLLDQARDLAQAALIAPDGHAARIKSLF